MEFLIDRENQKLLVKLTKLADLKHELFMHIMCTYRKKPANDDIDEELRPLLKSMWEDGYKTLACCSGHGDAGYIVYRPYRCKRWRVIAWPPEVKIPQSVEDLANSKDFIIREFFIEIKMPLGELEKIVKHSEEYSKGDEDGETYSKRKCGNSNNIYEFTRIYASRIAHCCRS